MSTTEPSFEEYEFGCGDRVRVNCANGKGPLDAFVGTVSGISRFGGNVIVAVEAADDQYPENSIYDGAPVSSPPASSGSSPLLDPRRSPS